ncbi:hypothetical protein Tco_0149911 [Tanacetum coccineum]
MTPDGRLELKEKVFQWLKEGMIRKVRHPVWVANTILVKLANGTWKVQVDYSSLNKVCAKDMYPFLEEGEGLASIMGYPYKCFLEMTEDDEEKTGFHTEEGVYCFTHMPKELKNSVATLQRMTEEVLADQRGRNVEIYLEEIVIKSKSELYLVQDVEETLRKLKRVNIKIDLVTSSFGVKEGRFLGFMVTKEGVRADPEKVRMRFEATEGSGWTNEAEKALQRIKRKLNKLQTLVVPKEGEILMLCLRQKDETISYVLLVERDEIQIPVSYVSRPLQGMEICVTPPNWVAAEYGFGVGKLGSFVSFREMITSQLQEKLWLYDEVRTRLCLFCHHQIGEDCWDFRFDDYKINIRMKQEGLKSREAEGSVAKKFFRQGEQVEETPNANEGGKLNLSRKLQAKSTLTPRAWRTSRLCKQRYERLACLHGFTKVGSQTEGNHTPATEQERKYKKEIMDATAPFHKFRITHLPKILNSKAKVLTGLATIKLEFLN